jgi:LmbE family N-acetylglucosaminyl deacetylase
MTISDAPLTFMAVHAHPDDEVFGTGGVLCRYSAEGIRTVLVTCTNGELGDTLGGAKPGEPGHDEAAVVAQRRQELEHSCAILGVSDLELLGYHDSGMMGWEQNDAPGSFWTTPVEDAAAKLAALMERYRPQVVATYDQRGFYGHPDHIQAHRITMAAAERTGIPERVYFTAVPRSALPAFAEALRTAGIEPPEPVEENREFGTPDERIAAVIYCAPYSGRKFDALQAHASQAENTFFLRLGPELFAKFFAFEAFEDARTDVMQRPPADDLFAGLR